MTGRDVTKLLKVRKPKFRLSLFLEFCELSITLSLTKLNFLFKAAIAAMHGPHNLVRCGISGRSDKCTNQMVILSGKLV